MNPHECCISADHSDDAPSASAIAPNPSIRAVLMVAAPNPSTICGDGALTVDADFRVPPPFRTFAVRSEEACHAHMARAPYGRVHRVALSGLDSATLGHLAAHGRSRTRVQAFGDIDYAESSPAELAALVPAVDLIGQIALALLTTGVLGRADACEPAYRQAVASRIDHLASHGAGFHNDVARHWTRCLFWNLALEVQDVEFVMPHAGIRLPLRPGDLLVFDQTLAHGLCRPWDQGRAQAPSFERGDDACQFFLAGELLVSDVQWTRLGAPWRPVEAHHAQAALELSAAEFDECSGAIQRPLALRDCMLRSTRYADDPASDAG